MSTKGFRKGFFSATKSLPVPILNPMTRGLDSTPIIPVETIIRLPRKKGGLYTGKVSSGKEFVSVRIPRNSGRTLWSVI